MSERHFTDSEPYEQAQDAIQGAGALAVLIGDAVCEERRWSAKLLDQLFTAQRVLIDEGLRAIDELKAEQAKRPANALKRSGGAAG